MTRFEKISREQFEKDFHNENVNYNVNYEDIQLPRRATRLSAGYDIFATIDFDLAPGETVKFPTGIRVLLDDNKFLMIAPRSGLGFKYRLQLDNTVGIIDADYYGSSNEGHLWIKLTNDSNEGKVLHIKKGDAIAQGIIIEYHKTDDDDVQTVRDGGFGSTDKKA